MRIVTDEPRGEYLRDSFLPPEENYVTKMYCTSAERFTDINRITGNIE